MRRISAFETICIVMLLALGAGCTSAVQPGLDTADLPNELAAHAPSLQPDQLSGTVHTLVNEKRRAHGLPPLERVPDLEAVARGHSEDMAAYRYFSHVNREGQSPSERALERGALKPEVKGRTVVLGVGENLFLTHRFDHYYVDDRGQVNDVDWKSGQDIAEQAVAGWLSSPSHRDNLLSRAYDEAGIGVALGDDFTVYITQNLR